MGLTASAEVVTLFPIKDNTIYDNANNSNAKGALAVGHIYQATGLRRALMQFDIAANVPAGAMINSVTLRLTQLKLSNAAPLPNDVLELHPLFENWGEGTSNAGGVGSAGAGAAATVGDATWNDGFFNVTPWNTPGGEFGGVSGTANFGPLENANYTFASQTGIVVDVQSWLNNPASNFGWALKLIDTSEDAQGSARLFASRESGPSSPLLTVDFTAVPEPSSMALLGISAVVMSTLRSRRRRSDSIL